jgi:MFS family permease
MTSSVQLGFIAGTLGMALLGVADRFSPRLLFLALALAGAACNLGLLAAANVGSVLVARFATGVCLAGVYPVGMKTAAGWYREGLGRAMGWLVGALVAGTALPHLLRDLGAAAPWQAVVVAVSLVAGAGGLSLALLVPDGPHLVPRGRFRPGAVFRLFAVPGYRASVFGYFGHMWELYTMWTFVPLLLAAYAAAQRVPDLRISWWSFWIIGAGALGCVGGGLLAGRLGSARVAAAQLLASGLCCLALPLALAAPPAVFLGFLLFWGVVVVGDSPQFSALNARTAPAELVGTGLTLAVSVGFALTIASIELTAWLAERMPLGQVLALLAVGPVLGLAGLAPLLARGR